MEAIWPVTVTEGDAEDGMPVLKVMDPTGTVATWAKDPAGVWFHLYGPHQIGSCAAIDDYLAARSTQEISARP